jgi:hypothetical protein
MKNTTLVITSIAGSDHPVLNIFAKKSKEHNVPFIVIGDTKSPAGFHLEGCDFYSIERQKSLIFQLLKFCRSGITHEKTSATWLQFRPVAK